MKSNEEIWQETYEELKEELCQKKANEPPHDCSGNSYCDCGEIPIPSYKEVGLKLAQKLNSAHEEVLDKVNQAIQKNLEYLDEPKKIIVRDFIENLNVESAGNPDCGKKDNLGKVKVVSAKVVTEDDFIEMAFGKESSKEDKSAGKGSQQPLEKSAPKCEGCGWDKDKLKEFNGWKLCNQCYTGEIENPEHQLPPKGDEKNGK